MRLHSIQSEDAFQVPDDMGVLRGAPTLVDPDFAEADAWMSGTFFGGAATSSPSSHGCAASSAAECLASIST